ncbi:MAG: hypothetical protein Q4E09_04075 [Eubacteriales bacterium]|nr:hypothetical protein [Eubacteriales bacterium]
MTSLRRIFLLVQVMLKGGTGLEAGGFSSLGRKKKQKRKLPKLGSILLYLFFAAYMVFIAIMLAKGLAPNFIAMGLDKVYFELFLAIFAMMTVVFGFFATFSTLAFAKDQERLVTMPIKRGELLLARMCMIFLNQCLIPFLLGLPIFYTYAYYKGSAWTFYVKVALGMFLQTLLPVAILVILSLILIRVTPLAKNRDRFMVISQVVAIVVIMVFVFGGQSFNMEMDPQNFNTDKVPTGIYPVMSKMVPNLDFLRDFLMLEGTEAALAFLKFFAVAVVFVVLAYFVADKFYRLDSSSGVKKRKLEDGEMDRALRAKSTFSTLLGKELKQVMRNPTIFTNNVLGSLLMPVFLLVPLIYAAINEGGNFNLPAIRRVINNYFQNGPADELGYMVATVALAIAIMGHFFVSSSCLNSSAMSREGEELTRGMVLPLNYLRQLRIKSLVSYFLATVPFLIVMLVVGLIIYVPIKYLLFWLLIYGLTAHNANQIALIFDVSKPALDWENEIYAVKGNKRIFLNLVANWVIAAAYGLLIYFMYKSDRFTPGWTIGVAAVLLFATMICLHLILPRVLQRTLGQIERYL